MSKIPEGGLGNGTWRGAFWIAQRQAPLRGEGFGERGEGLPTEAGAVAFGIVVHAPGRERGAGMVQGREQRLVQQFVTQAAVEALDEGVLGRLARRDVVPVDPAVVGEGQDRVQGELGPVAADYGLGLSANFEQGRQLPCYPCAGQGRVGDQREAFPRAVVDHGQHPEATAIGQLVGHEVERPELGRHQRQRHRGPRADRPLAPAATAHVTSRCRRS